MSTLAKYSRYRKKGLECIVYKKSIRDTLGVSTLKGYTTSMLNNRAYSTILLENDDDDDKGYASYDKKDVRITVLKAEVAKLKRRLSNKE